MVLASGVSRVAGTSEVSRDGRRLYAGVLIVTSCAQRLPDALTFLFGDGRPTPENGDAYKQ
jgi:hypothetical protein